MMSVPFSHFDLMNKPRSEYKTPENSTNNA
jgi:hypothetical protein